MTDRYTYGQDFAGRYIERYGLAAALSMLAGFAEDNAKSPGVVNEDTMRGITARILAEAQATVRGYA
jgi:hypothetical protein